LKRREAPTSMDEMAGSRKKPEEWGHGIALILRELADLKAELAEDRKHFQEYCRRADEDRKQFQEYCRRADEDRKQFQEYCRRADEDRQQAGKDRKDLTQALRIIGSEGRKFRVGQDRLVRLVETQGSLLREIRDVLRGRPGGGGNGRPAA